MTSGQKPGRFLFAQLLQHPGSDGLDHLIQMVVVAVIISRYYNKFRIVVLLCGINRALHWHRLIRISMNQQNRPLVPVDRFLHVDGLCNPHIIAPERQILFLI